MGHLGLQRNQFPQHVQKNNNFVTSGSKLRVAANQSNYQRIIITLRCNYFFNSV